MSIATVKAQLKVLEESIPGIKRAFREQPVADVGEMDAPFFVNYARAAVDNYQALGSDTDHETRTYVLSLYVFPAVLGTELDAEWEGKVEPFITSVKAFFKARPQLGGLARIQRALITGDSGPILKGVWGGVDFTLQVIEYQPIIYEDAE